MRVTKVRARSERLFLSGEEVFFSEGDITGGGGEVLLVTTVPLKTKLRYGNSYIFLAGKKPPPMCYGVIESGRLLRQEHVLS